MEKATRERLTGAVILVAVLAIAVPELLSGPGGEAAPTTERAAEAGPPLATYDLAIEAADGEATGRQQELIAAPAARTEEIVQAVPPPVTESTRVEPMPEAVSERQPLPQAAPDASVASGNAARSAPPSAPVTAKTLTAPPSRSAASTAGQWWVQLGSFSSTPNAENLARELRGKGFDIEVAKVRSGGRDLMRVRAGPVADRDAAVALRQRLEALGKKGASLVGP